MENLDARKEVAPQSGRVVKPLAVLGGIGERRNANSREIRTHSKGRTVSTLKLLQTLKHTPRIPPRRVRNRVYRAPILIHRAQIMHILPLSPHQNHRQLSRRIIQSSILQIRTPLFPAILPRLPQLPHNRLIIITGRQPKVLLHHGRILNPRTTNVVNHKITSQNTKKQNKPNYPADLRFVPARAQSHHFRPRRRRKIDRSRRARTHRPRHRNQ